MAERDIISAFDDCIDRLNTGATVADCLEVYPHYASQLAPMLNTGRLVDRARIDPAEVQAAQVHARVRVLEAIRVAPPRRDNILPFRRLASLTAAFALVMAVFVGGTGLAAESSLPGDTLYGYKRFTENVRLVLFDGDLGQVFAQRRIDEIQQLEAINRAEAVDFTGEIEVIDGISWQIAGLSTIVPANTRGAAEVEVSDVVTVQGHTTTAGTLVADVIQLLEPGDMLPTATPTPMLTPTPTPTGTPAPTFTPTASPQPQQTALPAGAPGECVPTPPPDWVSYRVRGGDTLSRLAGATGTSLEQVMQVNCIVDARFIVAGQAIFLPSIPPAAPSGGSGSSSGPDRGSGGSDDDDDDGGDDDD